jgi:hypothetical protein
MQLAAGQEQMYVVIPEVTALPALWHVRLMLAELCTAGTAASQACCCHCFTTATAATTAAAAAAGH